MYLTGLLAALPVQVQQRSEGKGGGKEGRTICNIKKTQNSFTANYQNASTFYLWP